MLTGVDKHGPDAFTAHLLHSFQNRRDLHEVGPRSGDNHKLHGDCGLARFIVAHGTPPTIQADPTQLSWNDCRIEAVDVNRLLTLFAPATWPDPRASTG